MNVVDERLSLETEVTCQLVLRGLQRTRTPLAFRVAGTLVQLSIDASVYRGHVISVIEHGRKAHQFRARYGVYEWDPLARCVGEVARRQLTAPPMRAPAARRPVHETADPFAPLGGDSVVSVAPSSARGKVRVKLSEIDVDPVTAMQLYAALRHVRPAGKPDEAIL